MIDPTPRRTIPLAAVVPCLLLGALLGLPPGPGATPAAAQAEPSTQAPRGTAGDQAPSEARQALDRAFEALGQGDLQTAIDELEALRASGDAPEPVLGTLGALYFEVGDAEQALEILQPLADSEDAGAAVLYNAGRAALVLGELERAQRYLERSLELESGTPAARELGILKGGQQRYGQAFQLLRPWVAEHPDDTEARRAAALCAVMLGRVADAEDLLGELPQDDPGTRLLWGRLLLLKGEPQGALSTLETLLSEAPPEIEPDVRRALGEVYLELGQAEDALDVLEGKVPISAANGLLIARAKYQNGNLEEALQILGPFAERLPEVGIDRENPLSGLATGISRDYGRWLVNAGRHEEALPYLRLATEAQPDDKQAWKALGQALAATGDREQARQALAKFQELAAGEGSESERVDRARADRADPTLRGLRRARQLLEDDQPEQALEVLRAEQKMSPDDLRPRLLEARVLLILGRNEEALQAAEEALQMAPDHPDARYQRGVALLALERFDAAEQDLRAAIRAAPQHVAAMNDLAVLLTLQGERQEARQLLERVLELRPDDPRANENLERLRGGEGG